MVMADSEHRGILALLYAVKWWEGGQLEWRDLTFKSLLSTFVSECEIEAHYHD